MVTTRTTQKKSDTPEWLRCRDTIRKLIRHLGKDSLVYAKEILEYEDNESTKLAVFWESARKFFDDSVQEKPILKPEPVAPAEAKEGS